MLLALAWLLGVVAGVVLGVVWSSAFRRAALWTSDRVRGTPSLPPPPAPHRVLRLTAVGPVELYAGDDPRMAKRIYRQPWRRGSELQLWTGTRKRAWRTA